MKLQTEALAFQGAIVLQEPTGTLFRVEQGKCTVSRANSRLAEVRLIFEVNQPLFQRIEDAALFNLQPEVRGHVKGGSWRALQKITVEILLSPKVLAQLPDTDTHQPLTSYLAKLSTAQQDHPLLKTQNWYLLTAYQPQQSATVSYRTLWSYLDLNTLQQPTEAFYAGIRQFMGESPAIQKILAEEETLDENLLDQAHQWSQLLFESSSPQTLVNNVVEGLIEMMRTLVQEHSLQEAPAPQTIEHLFEKAGHLLEPVGPSANRTLLEAVKAFLTDDDWLIEPTGAPHSLSLSFQGDAGEWKCYALVREEEREFLFYSMVPLAVPDGRRQDMSEFVCRANFGLSIGNFELNFADGEMRYKTSVDVTDSDLSPALVRNVVYGNLFTFDRYLPGVLGVIAGVMSPEAAIATLEHS